MATKMHLKKPCNSFSSNTSIGTMTQKSPKYAASYMEL